MIPPNYQAIDVGYELPVLHVTLTSEQVRRFAQVAGIPAGRFQSDEEARREGLPGQIAPGNMSLSQFSRVIAQAFPGAILKRLSATFRGMVRPNHPCDIRGVVTEKHVTRDGHLIECDLVLESVDGDRWATGTASVLLPMP